MCRHTDQVVGGLILQQGWWKGLLLTFNTKTDFVFKELPYNAILATFTVNSAIYSKVNKVLAFYLFIYLFFDKSKIYPGSNSDI